MPGERRHRCECEVILFVLVSALLAGCSESSANRAAGGGAARDVAPITLRIGCQKSSLLLNLLRSNGRLQKELGDGVVVEWKEFPAGPQLLEAMNVGAVDFGHAGETPPIFAEAAGGQLVYAANEEASPAAEAILVPVDSPIRQVADLKGKRVALNKGSNVHYFLVRALEQAGLTYADVQPVFLPPADARAAFESRSVDAWAIWDPYYAAAERAGTARLLVDGTGTVANRGFYLATRRIATEHPELLSRIVDELSRTSDWVAANHEATVKFLADVLGMDSETIDRAELRRKYRVSLIQPDVVAYQQEVADCLLRLELIPRPVEVARDIWQPAK